jgi:hypothetical protein
MPTFWLEGLIVTNFSFMNILAQALTINFGVIDFAYANILDQGIRHRFWCL